ncbi:AMP-binding protein [Micromonospora sp. NPDC049275]|uniref:AMP-binding enzyme n=1 Tax=Micromonospora sp. NPDC049275 TaxID=3364268 RepID=UPI00371015C2
MQDHSADPAPNLAARVRRAALDSGDRPALHWREGRVSWSELDAAGTAAAHGLAAAAPPTAAARPLPRRGGDDLAVLLYTSGTEGRPKGAMLSHRALLADHVRGLDAYPHEVELVLAGHPGVVESAVPGVPHPRTGETVRAYVVPAQGRPVTSEELLAHCARNLARFKCPTAVEFVDALPHSSIGKVRKTQLRSATPTARTEVTDGQ